MSTVTGPAAHGADGAAAAAPNTAPAAEPNVAELLAQVQALAARVEHLEAELVAVRSQIPAPPVPPEVVLAISAAVAEFLGKRARVKQVHYRTSRNWALQGRAAVHGHQILHGVR